MPMKEIASRGRGERERQRENGRQRERLGEESDKGGERRG